MAAGHLSGAAAKRAKLSEKRRESILGALECAESLSQSCRKMLATALPRSLGVAHAERDAIQTEMVGLIEKGLRSEEARLRSENEGAAAEVASVADETKNCEEDQKYQEEALAAKAKDIAAKEEQLSVDTVTEGQSIKQAADAKSSLESLEGDLKEISDGKEALEKVHADDFVLLRDSPPEDKRVAKAHIRNIEKTLQPFGVGEALLVGVPSTLLKPVAKRGPFDAVVLEKVNEVLTAEIAKKAERLQGSEQEKAEKTAAMESTKAAQEAATAQKDSSREALQTAEAEKMELEGKLKVAQHLAKDLTRRSKEAAAAVTRATKADMDFKAVLAGFFAERDGEPAEKPSLAAEAAPAVDAIA